LIEGVGNGVCGGATGPTVKGDGEGNVPTAVGTVVCDGGGVGNGAGEKGTSKGAETVTGGTTDAP